MTSAAAAALLVVAVCGCSDSRKTAPSKAPQTGVVGGLRLVAAPPALREKCRATARVVGYAVPCLTRIPSGMAIGWPRPAGCLDVIGPGGVGGCDKSWRGWVVGNSSFGGHHLGITASPRALTSYAKLVNGPAWYPRAKVRRLGWVEINGRRMRSVYVPPATNDGSAFRDHVVLIWSEGGHTYGIGVHKTRGIRRTSVLNEELARHIELVRP